MVQYPYILKTGSLKTFLQKVPTIGIPDKVNQKYLPSVGFTSSNDRSILQVLKFLKFIDTTGSPTERYKKYRDTTQSAIVLGAAIKENYGELFKVYSDAQNKDHNTLRNFFSTNTGLGERAVKAIVETFKALTSLADLKNSESISDSKGEKSEEYVEDPGVKADRHTLNIALGEGRKATITAPSDITPEEIDKLKRFLEVMK